MSINIMELGKENKLPGFFDKIYKRYNIEKSLVNLHSAINLDILQENLNRQIISKLELVRSSKDNIALMDYLYTSYYVAHARIAKLLNSIPEKEITCDSASELGKRVVGMLEEQEDMPSDRFFAYFNALATKKNEPLTASKLDKRVIEMIETSEFADEDSFEDRKVILQVAYSVLDKLIAHSGDSIENPQKYMSVLSKTFYSNGEVEGLSDEEKEIFEQINSAKKEAVEGFLLNILLSPEDGEISRETVEKRYKRFIDLDILNSNSDIEYRRNVETIYQAVQASIVERDGKISRLRCDEIRSSYKEKIPSIRNQVIVSLLLGENRTFSVEELDERLKSVLDNMGESSTEDRMDLKNIYGLLVSTIQSKEGIATTEDLKNAMSKSVSSMEIHREGIRKMHRSPFKIYPMNSTKTPEEIYEEKLIELENDLDDAISEGNIQKAQMIMATAQVFKELIEPAKNLDRIREEELVSYEVDATRGHERDSLRIGVCDVELIRLGEPENVITMENSVGDTISVVRVGRFGYAAMRKPDGTPLFNDNMSTQEYLVTKKYNSRARDGKEPETRTFRVFSKTLIPEEMVKSEEIYSIYANQIFSDLSLEAAAENNGGLIASVSPRVMRKDGTIGPEIAFDINTLDACLTLEEKVREYEDAEKENASGRKKIKSIGHLALVGNSNLEVSDGFATRILLHDTVAPQESEEDKRDVIFAFEWSDVQKKKTIFDIVRDSELRNR